MAEEKQTRSLKNLRSPMVINGHYVRPGMILQVRIYNPTRNPMVIVFVRKTWGCGSPFGATSWLTNGGDPNYLLASVLGGVPY